MITCNYKYRTKTLAECMDYVSMNTKHSKILAGWYDNIQLSTKRELNLFVISHVINAHYIRRICIAVLYIYIYIYNLSCFSPLSTLYFSILTDFCHLLCFKVLCFAFLWDEVINVTTPCFHWWHVKFNWKKMHRQN